MYFFGVQANPSHNGSLVAVFPLVHRLRACLAIAASVDGVRWTRVTPLLSCRLYGERTMDHPAAPSMVRRGSEIWLYVQEEVPGITVERTTPMATHTQLLKSEKVAEPCGALHVPLPAARALDRGCAAQAARLPEEAGRQRADAVCAHVRRAWRWGSSQRGGG